MVHTVCGFLLTVARRWMTSIYTDQIKVSIISWLNSIVQGRRHDFGIGEGLSQRWGEKCAHEKFFDHTHQYVNTPTYRAYLL